MDAPKRIDFDRGKDLHLSGYDFTDLKYCILRKYVLMFYGLKNGFSKVPLLSMPVFEMIMFS